MHWLMENSTEVKSAIAAGNARFGTVDSWLLWNSKVAKEFVIPLQSLEVHQQGSAGIGDQPAMYALEGSVAVTGSAIQWLRAQLHMPHQERLSQ